MDSLNTALHNLTLMHIWISCKRHDKCILCFYCDANVLVQKTPSVITFLQLSVNFILFTTRVDEHQCHDKTHYTVFMIDVLITWDMFSLSTRVIQTMQTDISTPFEMASTTQIIYMKYSSWIIISRFANESRIILVRMSYVCVLSSFWITNKTG